MRIIEPSAEIIIPNATRGIDICKHIEKCGRICYKSEGKITDDSYILFIQKILERGHEAVLEHFSISIKFVCDRGVSHEIVRHRLASYCQESTRYCNYIKDDFGGEITVIKPCYLVEGTKGYFDWKESCEKSESAYFDMLEFGCKPQEARAVLPNSLKTEIMMTANLREWRHFFRLRCSKAAHPQMREVAFKALVAMQEYIPIIFDDVANKVIPF